MRRSPKSAHAPVTDREEGLALPPEIGNLPLTDIVSGNAAMNPEGIAALHEATSDAEPQQLTYGRLEHLADRWAARLGHEGVLPGSPVGLCLSTGLHAVIGFISILKAGGAVLPLDPSIPATRLNSMAEGVGCKTVIGGSFMPKFVRQQLLDLSTDPGDHPAIEVARDPERTAVIFHTSGSTGHPKPVAVTHRAISSRIRSMIDWFGLSSGEVVCAGSIPAFDPFLQQLFFALCTGGTVWLPDRLTLLDPDRFWRSATRHGVTHLNLVPTQMELLLAMPPSQPLRDLRRVVIGGERMSPDLPSRIASALGTAEIYNMYGPTEGTVDATGYRTDPTLSDREIPIGKPLPGCRVRILDESMRRLSDGKSGELFIGGAGLAAGYVGMEEATARSFIDDPYLPGARLYRTGDIAEWLPDGQILFVGRRDEQVKIRGQRLEMGEVESVIRTFPGISASVVVKWDDAPGGPALAAYVISDDELSELPAFLAERLPAAAIPASIMRLDALPKLPSGKIDRKSLPSPTPVQPSAPTAGDGTSSSLERSIATVWAGILGREHVDVSANLFETGANSLHVPAVLAGIEAATGRKVSAVDLFRYPTIAALAKHLSPASPTTRPAGATRSREVGEEIAVVGMALRFPGSNDPDTFWNDLMTGADRIVRYDRETLREKGAPSLLVDHPDFVSAHGAVDGIEQFDPVPFGYSQGEAAEIDPQQRMLLELSWQALEDAACDPETDGPVGVYVGVGFNSYMVDNLLDHFGIAGSPDRFSIIIRSEKDFAATRISYKLGLTGPSMSINSACSTALSAIATAIDSIRAGRCRMALVGAASLGMFSPYGHIHAEGGIDSVSGICRPFDADADGVVGGAGGAVLVLKRLDEAVADGDRIYATIRGIGISNDGGAKAAYSAPSVDGQVAAISAALSEAGVDPTEIGFVEGHGTATALGDPIEVAALNAIYQVAEPGSILLGSVKGNIGHLDSSAGMAGLVKAILVVQHGVIPPMAHFTAPNPKIPFAEGPFRINTAPEPCQGTDGGRRFAGLNSFGMGGTNVHVIIGNAPEPVRPEQSASPSLVTFSAATPTALERLTAQLESCLEEPISDMASSLARRRPLRYRRAVVATGPADALIALRSDKPIFGEVSGASISLASLFPGQGSQEPGMAFALYHAIPAFRAVVDEASKILKGGPLADLTSLLLDRSASKSVISETQLTQPLLFITEFAMQRALEAFGLRPEAMIGHSIGEYAAACASGMLEFEEALHLVAIRGSLMASTKRGAMLAVSAPESELRPLLERCGADLSGVNGARQCVASGTGEQISELERLASEAGKPCQRLSVSHAFHSSLMDPVLDQFADAVSKLRLQPPTIPIISNLSGEWLKPEEATDPTYWVRHLRGTVRFADGLRLLASDPGRVLIEAGPGAVLSRLARGAGIPENRIVTLQPAGSPDGHTDFLSALGRLWVAGAPVDRLAAAGNASRRISLPTYPFERIRLWIEPGKEPATTLPRQQGSEPVPLPQGFDATEALIAGVWQEVLGVTDLHPDDHFLALGGDSLIAVRIAAKLRQRLECEISVTDVFLEGTIAGLARLIDADRPDQTSPVEAAASVSTREKGWL